MSQIGRNSFNKIVIQYKPITNKTGKRKGVPSTNQPATSGGGGQAGEGAFTSSSLRVAPHSVQYRETAYDNSRLSRRHTQREAALDSIITDRLALILCNTGMRNGRPAFQTDVIERGESTHGTETRMNANKYRAGAASKRCAYGRQTKPNFLPAIQAELFTEN